MTVAFIGLGAIGLPMATTLIRKGIPVVAFDLVEENVRQAVQAGARGAENAAQAAAEADAVITMVVTGAQSRHVYLEDGVVAHAKPGSIFMDCSTVDIESSRILQEAAAAAGHDMVDAPVSGGPPRAAEGKLAIMAGGTEKAFNRARPFLEAMGSSVHHMGSGGTGLATKICNNLLTGINLAGASEAFTLGERLGLDTEKLFKVISASSGNSWVLQNLCPVAGPVPTSPANHDYKAQGAAYTLQKDLGLAQAAALLTKVPSPMGSAALSLYTMLDNAGLNHLDCCAVIKMYQAGKR
jgi:3-hydroxyisobutyrate dehydrogenase